MKKETKGTFKPVWILPLCIFCILMLAILELGQHTVLGWILGFIAVIGFTVFRVIKKGTLPGYARVLSFMALLAVFILILFVSVPPVKPVPAVKGKNGGITDTVELKQGLVTGVKTADGEVEVYAGIPYAKPPVGERRFREPEPADGWDGVLAADHFAPMSMQTQNSVIFSSLAQIVGYHDYKAFSFEDNYRTPVSEDSLYVNVWKPVGNAANLPVLVYIHGGVLQTGQPWYEDYSGEGLAREGVIVVNMGYRLGVFGFFADEELAGESENHTTGNYGLLDQIMALKWVQENIEAFGGDPGNVTLAGESAGSACVTALCTSPLAKGLFRRVVAESSTVTSAVPTHSFRSMEEALEAGEETKKRFHVSSASELRNLPAERIVGELEIHHHMTVDGYALTETPYESFKKGIHNEEASMHGYNKEEAAPFILFEQANLNNYERKIRDYFGDPYSDEILALMPAATDEEARRNWANLYSVIFFNYGHYCLERQELRDGVPTFVYYFTKDNGRLGSWHSGEEVYLYGNIPADSKLYDEGDRELSRVMQGYFKNFITYGDPNGVASDADLDAGTDGNAGENADLRTGALPYWPESKAPGMVMELGDTVSLKEAPYPELYPVLDRFYEWEE